MIVPATIAGALVGAGLLVALKGLVAPPQPALSRRLEALGEPPAADHLDAVRSRSQRWGVMLLSRSGVDVAALSQNLAVSGVSMERHAVAKLTYALGGAAVPVAMAAVWQVSGISVSPVLVVLGSVSLAVVGFMVPDVLLARMAEVRRREFRYALSLYLDLVVIVLAGGGGVNTALVDAAGAGSGWAFSELSGAVHGARLRRTAPWVGLRDLSERIGCPELEGLASSVELSGTSGARVRESLRAKAISVRDHELSATEAEALAASERMGAPMVGMFVGLMMLIGYPAVVTLLSL